MFTWGKKKDKSKSSEPAKKVASKTPTASGMPGVQPQPASHKLDIKAMNFGKFAYRKDDEYKALKPLMENYNANNSPENEIKLIEAAYKYLDAHSTKEVEEHKGRCANVEKIIFQLTMKDDTVSKALDNITNLSSGVTYDKNLSEEKRHNTTDALTGMKQMIERGSITKQVGETETTRQMSPIARAAMTGVMADQEKSSVHAEFTSNAQRKYDSIARDSYHTDVNIRSSNDFDDTITSMAHEFTHVSVGESFQNTDNFLSHSQSASEKEILDIRDDRERRVAELESSVSTIDEKASKNGYTANYVTSDRLPYGAYYDKVKATYLPQSIAAICRDMNVLIHPDSSSIYDKIKDQCSKGNFDDVYNLIQEVKSSPYASTCKNAINDCYTYINEFRVFADSQAERIESPDYKDKVAYKNSDGLSQEEKSKAIHEVFISGQSGSNTVVEYDAVINQMLMNYELKTDDRSSLHYRQLKSAAAGAHVRRHIAKLQQTQGTQETEAETVAQPQAQEEKPDFMSDEIGTLAKTMGAVSPNTDDPKQLAVGLRKMFDAMKDEKDADEKERRKNNLKTYMKQCGYSSTSWVDTY